MNKHFLSFPGDANRYEMNKNLSFDDVKRKWNRQYYRLISFENQSINGTINMQFLLVLIGIFWSKSVQFLQRNLFQT